MSDILLILNTPGGSLAFIAAVLAIFLVVVATYLPKFMNAFKTDKLDGNILNRLEKMEAYASAQAKKNSEQDHKIHRFAVKVTKLVVVMIRLESLLMFHNIPIPQDLQDEINELKDDPEEY
jgi:ClpP class serine protease